VLRVSLDDLEARMNELERRLSTVAALLHRLVCESCGAVSEGRAEGWRALLGREDDDRKVVVVLCPECARDVDTHS
jgi:hypothetical protein